MSFGSGRERHDPGHTVAREPSILPPTSGSFYDSPQRRGRYPSDIIIAAGRPGPGTTLTSPAFANIDSPGILRNLCSTSSDPSLFSHSYAQQLKREHFQPHATHLYTTYAHTESGTSTSTHLGSDMIWEASSSHVPVATSTVPGSARLSAQRSASTPAVAPQLRDAYWGEAQEGAYQPHASTSYRPQRVLEDHRDARDDIHAGPSSLRPGNLAVFPRHSYRAEEASTEGRGSQARRGLSPYLTKSHQDFQMMESPRVAHPDHLVDGREDAASWNEPGRHGAGHIDALPPILTMDQLQKQLRMRHASNRSQLAFIAPATMGHLSQDDWDVTSPAAPAAAAPNAELYATEDALFRSRFGSPPLFSLRTYPPDPSESPACARCPKASSYAPPSRDGDFASHLANTRQADRADTSGPPMYAEIDERDAASSEVDDKRLRGSRTPKRSPSAGVPSDGSADEQRDARAKRTGKLPAATTAHLKGWLMAHVHHPYPTEDEKRGMCLETKLNMCQVSNWFINARRRILPSLGTVTIPGNRKQVQVQAVGELVPPRLNAIGARLPPTRASATAARLQGQAYAANVPISPSLGPLIPHSSPSYAHFPQAFHSDPRVAHPPFLYSASGSPAQDATAPEGHSQSLSRGNTRRLSA